MSTVVTISDVLNGVKTDEAVLEVRVHSRENCTYLVFDDSSFAVMNFQAPIPDTAKAVAVELKEAVSLDFRGKVPVFRVGSVAKKRVIVLDEKSPRAFETFKKETGTLGVVHLHTTGGSPKALFTDTKGQQVSGFTTSVTSLFKGHFLVTNTYVSPKDNSYRFVFDDQKGCFFFPASEFAKENPARIDKPNCTVIDSFKSFVSLAPKTFVETKDELRISSVTELHTKAGKTYQQIRLLMAGELMPVTLTVFAAEKWIPVTSTHLRFSMVQTDRYQSKPCLTANEDAVFQTSTQMSSQETSCSSGQPVAKKPRHEGQDF